MSNTRTTIGRNALLMVGAVANIPAKVDTGADSSSLWASDIREENDKLSFVLFDPTSSLYTGERIEAMEYDTVRIASSNGGRSERYVAYLPAVINGMQLPKVRFSLADRSTMAYPALLGRKTLDGVFVVDVSQQIPAEYEEKLHQQKQERAAQKSATLEKGN